MDNFSDLVQLHFAFASVFLSNTLVRYIDKNSNIICWKKENVHKMFSQHQSVT